MEIKYKYIKIKDFCFSKKSVNLINKNKYSNNNKYFMYGTNNKILGKINTYDYDEYIAISKDGSIGNVFYKKEKSSIISTMEYIFPYKNEIDFKYLFYLIKNINFEKYKVGSTIPHIYFNDWSNKIVKLLIDINKQKLIGIFFKKIDNLIYLNKELNKLNHEYKMNFINKIFNIKENKVNLNNLIKEFSIKNNENFFPVSIGKFGIKERKNKKDEKINFNKNKIIYKNTITFGLGTKRIEWGIYEGEKKYSVSPVYKTFKINTNLIIPIYLNSLLENNVNEISKKYMIISSRQGKTINFNDFLKHNFYISNLEEQIKFSNSILLINKLIYIYQDKINKYNEYKNNYLNKIFN